MSAHVYAAVALIGVPAGSLNVSAARLAFRVALAQTLDVGKHLVEITATRPVGVQPKQLRRLRASVMAPDVAFRVGVTSSAEAEALVATLTAVLAPPTTTFKTALVDSGVPAFASLTYVLITSVPSLEGPAPPKPPPMPSTSTEEAPAATIAKPRGSSSDKKNTIGAAAGAALGGSLLLCAGGYAFYQRRSLGRNVSNKDFRSMESARLNAMADAAAQYATALAAADQGPVSPRSMSRRLARNSSMADSLTRRAGVTAYTELTLDEAT